MLEPRRAADGLGGIGRDDAELGLHPRERPLDIEHALEIRALVEYRAHRVTAVQRAEDRAIGRIGGHSRGRQTSRNTVSPSPCSRTSIRQVAGPAGRAISVARRAGSSIEVSRGSVSLSPSPWK